MNNEQLEDLQDILARRLASLKQRLELPARPQPRYRAGQVVQVNLSLAKIVTAKIRKVFRQADGVRLLIEYERGETALIHPWQVLRRLSRLE
jgi:hypothetical protein